MLEKGQIIGGRYQIESVLGEGGMATVYRATHTGTRRPCAVKILKKNMAQHPSVAEMFVREAQIGAVVGDHPSIVEVFDAAIDGPTGAPFLAMPLLTGTPLDAALARQGALPWTLVSALFAQLGQALEQAHSAGVVHRDLKPANLFLTSDAAGPRVKILDFGIAKLAEAASSQTATHIGTPAYSAPEQLAPLLKQLASQMGVAVSRSVSPQTDIWPLGLIAYECLTGAAPGQVWGVCSAQELPLRSLGATPIPSREAGDAAPLLPPGFDAWFARCLEREADRRFSSALEACSALIALLGGEQPASLPPRPPPSATPVAATSLGVFTFAAPSSSRPGLPRADSALGKSAPLTSFAGTLGTLIPAAAQTTPPAQTAVSAVEVPLTSPWRRALVTVAGVAVAIGVIRASSAQGAAAASASAAASAAATATASAAAAATAAGMGAATASAAASATASASATVVAEVAAAVGSAAAGSATAPRRASETKPTGDGKETPRGDKVTGAKKPTISKTEARWGNGSETPVYTAPAPRSTGTATLPRDGKK